MLTKKKKFEAWSENGKYYIKTSRFSKKKEISRAKFMEIIENETITSIGFTQNQSLGLSELLEQYLKRKNDKTSEFGRRIKVVILEEKQFPSQEGGVDVFFKFDILDEKTQKTANDLYTITSNIEGVTGPLTDKEVYYPELFRSMYQMSFNGYLATDEERNKVKSAMKS